MKIIYLISNDIFAYYEECVQQGLNSFWIEYVTPIHIYKRKVSCTVSQPVNINYIIHVKYQVKRKIMMNIK